MFNFSYSFDYLGASDTFVPNPVNKSTYRFATPHRRYQVTFEAYSFDITAVKYCDMDDRNAANRYEKIFNDANAFKVISTCLHTMLDYWKRNPSVSFCFYAVPRNLGQVLVAEISKMPEEKRNKYIENYQKSRYAIYNYAMINLFDPKHFIHVRDKKNSVYVLINRAMPRQNTRIKSLGKFLLNNYEMIFEPEIM